MESLEPSRIAAAPAEYRVLLLDELAPAPWDLRGPALGSAFVHLIILLVLVSIPRDLGTETAEREVPHRITHLVDPPNRLTQKAPNKAPLSQEISVAPALPAPRPVPLPRKKFEAPPPAQIAKKQKAAPVLPLEPPKMNAAQTQQTVQIAPPAALTPPPPRTVEPPKIVLESPSVPPPSGLGTGRLKVPGGGIEEAVREIARGNAASSRSVGDDTDDAEGSGPLTPSGGRPKSSVELVSDPHGVDMKPYLLQVLQTVRRNWRAVYPESARLGLKGRVVIQFAIAPNGKITRVVFISESGRQALDRAGISALSMSDPLPQLPAEYKGDRVVLQFTFLYNAPR